MMSASPTQGGHVLNKVHVAATELPQLLLQNTKMLGEATADFV